MPPVPVPPQHNATPVSLPSHEGEGKEKGQAHQTIPNINHTELEIYSYQAHSQTH